MRKHKMGFLARLLLPVAIKIIGRIVRKVTPEIREEIEAFVRQWEVKCKATPNEIDDVIVVAIKGILGMQGDKT